MAKDKVYSQAQAHIVDFAFTSEVADVFPDMIRRSVPGYETVIPLTGLIAARELVDHDLVLDLGCSLGATSQALLSQSTLPNIRVVGVDNPVTPAPHKSRAVELVAVGVCEAGRF